MSAKNNPAKKSNDTKKAAKKQSGSSLHTPGELSTDAIEPTLVTDKSTVKGDTVDLQASVTRGPRDPDSSTEPATAPDLSQETEPKKIKSVIHAPDRKDVIQLATQLVSAQIAAHSHHETAMGLFNEFRQMALDVADLSRPRTVTTTIFGPEDLEPTGPVPDKATNTNAHPSDINETHSGTEKNVGGVTPDNHFDVKSAVEAGITSMISERLARFRSRKPPALQPMSHPDLDRLFQSAMRRAFVMLNAPFDPERVIFAEQIFSPSETLAEGAIRQRFIDFKWPDLKSAKPVITLMKDVNRWFTEHLKNLDATRQSVKGKEAISALDPTIPIKTRIEAEAEKLSWLLSQISSSDSLAPEACPSYRALETALSHFTSTHNGFDIGGAFRSLDAINANNLIFVMFGGIGPNDEKRSHATKGGKKAKDDTEDNGRITYRPWAIFRYLRRFGNKEGDELGMSLNRRLRAQHSKLNPAEIPDVAGIEPAEFAFGPLHEEIDDFFYCEETLGQSDIAEDSDELAAYAGDPGNFPGLSTELRNEDKDSNGIIPF
jgi:hypothetical protein